MGRSRPRQNPSRTRALSRSSTPHLERLTGREWSSHRSWTVQSWSNGKTADKGPLGRKRDGRPKHRLRSRQFNFGPILDSKLVAPPWQDLLSSLDMQASCHYSFKLPLQLEHGNSARHSCRHAQTGLSSPCPGPQCSFASVQSSAVVFISRAFQERPHFCDRVYFLRFSLGRRNDGPWTLVPISECSHARLAWKSPEVFTPWNGPSCLKDKQTCSPPSPASPPSPVLRFAGPGGIGPPRSWPLTPATHATSKGSSISSLAVRRLGTKSSRAWLSIPFDWGDPVVQDCPSIPSSDHF